MAALGQLGRVEEAQSAMAEAQERFGDSIRYFMSPPTPDNREWRPENIELIRDGLRKAGIVD
jgi:hypothetical protein